MTELEFKKQLRELAIQLDNSWFLIENLIEDRAQYAESEEECELRDLFNDIDTWCNSAVERLTSYLDIADLYND